MRFSTPVVAAGLAVAVLFIACSVVDATPPPWAGNPFAAVSPIQQPNLHSSDAWRSQSQTCLGHYASRPNPSTYNGVPALTWNPFTIWWSAPRQEWNVTFSGTTQYTNATGAWTNPQQKWYHINNITYNVQADFQKHAADMSDDVCYVRYTGLHRDITSCQCMLQSTITMFNITSLECKLRFLLERPNYLPTLQVLTGTGLVFIAWDATQLYTPRNIVYLLAFVGDSCVLGEPAVYPPVPAGNYPEHCDVYAPSSCNPPAGF